MFAGNSLSQKHYPLSEWDVRSTEPESLYKHKG